MHLNSALKDQSVKYRHRLGRIEGELNQLDSAIVCAVKTGCGAPSSSRIFRALNDASIACADVIDAYKARPIPDHVRDELTRLHCAMSDLTVSLQVYAQLSVSAPIAPR